MTNTSSMKKFKINEGEVYAIPLFVADQSPLKRFTKKDFAQPGQRFAFARVISDEGGGGHIIEVFRYVGGLDTGIDKAIASGRLFRPVAVTRLAMYKKRWPLLGRTDGYDKERDSQYSEIRLVMAGYLGARLWRGSGATIPVDSEEASKYEPWTIWGSNQVERRILDALESTVSGSDPSENGMGK